MNDQRSTRSQLHALHGLAIDHGLYDAADALEIVLKPAAVTQKVRMATASGVEIYLQDPWKTEIRLGDLRTHSNHICRYIGAVPVFLTQHHALCVLLAKALKHPVRIQALMAAHDMHEPIIGDVHTAIKTVLGDSWALLEAPWERRVHEALMIPFPTEEEAKVVRRLDLRALAVETRAHDYALAEHIEDLFGVVQDIELRCWLAVKAADNDMLWSRIIEPALASGIPTNMTLPETP